MSGRWTSVPDKEHIWWAGQSSSHITDAFTVVKKMKSELLNTMPILKGENLQSIVDTW